MSKLKEMKDSCAVFAADLKTGSVEWEIDEYGYFSTEILKQYISVWLEPSQNGENAEFWYVSQLGESHLQAETAKEAAHEALQLVKAEAQKLVDALSVEIQETESRQAEKEKDSWTFARKTLGDVKDSLVASIRKPEHLSDSVKTNHIRDIKIAIIAVDKMGLELKKYNALSEPKETPLVKIDPENIPKDEVFAINQHYECLGGQIVKNSKGVLSCVSEYDSISNPTHYCTYEQILKLLPKPQ